MQANQCPKCARALLATAISCRWCEARAREDAATIESASRRLGSLIGPADCLIPLTQGWVTLVSAEDYPALSLARWSVSKPKKNGARYAIRSIVNPDGSKTTVRMHALIMGGIADHIHHDHLPHVVDNRRSNLRLATNAQNCQSRRKQGGTSSIFKGVARTWRSNTWRSLIRVNGELRRLGSFRVEAYAAYRYDIEALKEFGPFALTNFPHPESTNYVYG